MKFIKSIVRKIVKEDKKIVCRWDIDFYDMKINIKQMLGRWEIDLHGVRMNVNIDLSNKDHCWLCGRCILDKTKICHDARI